MQIIIPMTGNGSRFKAAGYKRLKPFIKVHNKPIIHWLVEMFKEDEKNITFIGRKEHFKQYSYYKKDLKKYAPLSKLYLVDEWSKLGPASDILRASEVINDEEPVIVSYCDYFMNWNYKAFKKNLKIINPDGAIPCYKGFHPNLIPKKNLYATCEVDNKNFLKIIREKHQINKDKLKDLQSPGLYYFKSGKIMKKYCKEMIHNMDSVNEEFYMSLPFNYLVKDNLDVWCPNIVDKFCQWGTPEDLEEYNYWIRNLMSIKE